MIKSIIGYAILAFIYLGIVIGMIHLMGITDFILGTFGAAVFLGLIYLAIYLINSGAKEDKNER